MDDHRRLSPRGDSSSESPGVRVLGSGRVDADDLSRVAHAEEQVPALAVGKANDRGGKFVPVDPGRLELHCQGFAGSGHFPYGDGVHPINVHKLCAF